MFSFATDRPRFDAPVYRVPFFGLLAAGVASVAIGIARGAVLAIVDLARTKQPAGSRRTLAHRELVQLQVAQADAKVHAARAALRAAIEDAESQAARGDAPTLEARARLRIAACHATTESAAAVDLAYNAAGASAIHASSPLQRQLRDVHVATQHVMVAPTAMITAGRVLLGVETETSTL
jgi:alkylation response protein AidB-like acyl-CoA dehydrogenase